MPLGRKPVGVGIDVLSWKRAERFLACHSLPFLGRLLAPSEQTLLKNAADRVRVPLFARLFTAKEAAMKAFGDSWVEEGRFRQIEILLEDNDQFTVRHSETEGNFFETPDGIGAQIVLWSVVGAGLPRPYSF